MAQAAIDAGVPERLGPAQAAASRTRGTRALTQARHVCRTTRCPRSRVDPETYRVEVDGELVHVRAAGAACRSGRSTSSSEPAALNAIRHRHRRARSARARRGSIERLLPAPARRRAARRGDHERPRHARGCRARQAQRPDRPRARRRRRDGRLPAHGDPRGPVGEPRRGRAARARARAARRDAHRVGRRQPRRHVHAPTWSTTGST